MRTTSRLKLSALVAVLLATWAVASDPAAAEDRRMGAAWEGGIQLGIERQERERKQHAPETLVRRAKLLASRSTGDSDEVVRLYLLARAYGIAGDRASANDTYRDVLKLAPRCYFAYHDLALLALGGRPPDVAAAERHLRQAISLNPGFFTAQRKLALLLMQAERHETAVKYLRRVVDGDPADLQARFLLAQTLLYLEKTDEAEREVAILVRKEPRSPGFRELKAEVYLQRGRYEEALRTFRRIATENPTAPSPLRGILRVVDAQRTQGGTTDVESYLFALEGLIRLARDPTAKAELQKVVEDIRRHESMAKGVPTEGPPTDPQIAVLLQNVPPEQRIELLRYVYAREEVPAGELMLEAMSRLSPRKEPDPTARRWVLRILGRHGGYGLVGLVRHSLGDPDSTVRTIAADVLLELSAADAAAQGAALLVLGLQAESEDAALAVAARAAVRSLQSAAPEEQAETAESARRAAFRTWWNGPVAAEAQIKALARFASLNDPKPDDVILPYLAQADPYVVLAAWRAMAEAAGNILDREDAWRKANPQKAARLPAGRRRWLTSLPHPPDGEVSREDVDAARPRLGAWAAQRVR